MTSKTPAAMRSPRDRPLGYYPRGTSLGFVGLAMLAVGVPFFSLECATPVVPNGISLWVGSIPYVLGFCLIPMFVLTAGLRSHRFWVICLFFYFGSFLLAAYALSLPFAASVLLGAFTLSDPELRSMSVVGGILLLAMSPFTYFVFRALRLHYWQPGSTPDQWEPGDEGPPAWAMSNARKP